MLKTTLRLCAFLFLCLLLVYLPEIYSAVSFPYHIEMRPRILLRIALCSSDTLSADAFFKSLSSYMIEHPSIHIRVIRTNADQLFSLPDPQCDLLLFPDDVSFDPAFFLTPSSSALSLAYFSPSNGTPLLCGIPLHARQPEQALSLAGFLCGSAASKDAALSSID